MKSQKLWCSILTVLYGFFKSCAFLLVGGVAVAGTILAVSVYYESPMIRDLGVSFVKHFYFGLVAGFLIHEIAHALLLSITMRELKDIRTESSFARFSIIASGRSTGRGIFVTAMGGPVAAAAFGFFMNVVSPNFDLFAWYFLHLFFLLPLFGDGRAIIFGIRHWRFVVDIGE